MRAGKLRHVLTIERATVAPDDYGTPIETWAALATLRAEKVSETAAESIDATAGAREMVRLVFRTRAFGGVTLADRLNFRGKVYDLKEICGGDFREGRGLELHCEGRP